MAIWQATNVSIPNNSSIITVNTGDDVGNLFTGAIVQVNNLQFMTVKTVNTGASPQTIEIDELYTGSAVSGGTAIGAPTQGAIKEAAEELRLLRTTYENLADTVSTTGTANSLAKRTSAGRLKAADGSAVDDVVTVGQFENLETYDEYGIGRLTQCSDWPNSSLDNCNGVDTGFYRTSGSISAPDQTAIVYFMRRNAGQLQQILISGYDASNTNTFQWRNSNGGSDANPTWSDWKTVYHSGNSVNPIEYGVGTYRPDNGTPSDMKNVSADALAGGLYTGYEGLNSNATLGDNPFPLGGSAYGLLNISGVDPDPTKYSFQIAGQYSDAGLKWRNTAISGFSDWREIYHSGNSVNPIEYGIGQFTNNAPNIDGFDDNIAGGFWRGLGGTTSGAPDNVAYNLGVVAMGASTGTVFLAARNTNVASTDKIWYGNYRSSEGQVHWNELYGDHNVNFNEFGGTGAGDCIAVGFAVSSTTVRFFLPISSTVVATGVTIEGTFDVRAANGGYLATGVTPTVVGIHSNKYAVINFDSLSLSTGDPVWLSTNSASSKLTVTF